MSEKIPMDQFKKECLDVLDRVNQTQKKVVVTKQNVPIAEIRPIEKEEAFGKLKGTVHYHGDII